MKIKQKTGRPKKEMGKKAEEDYKLLQEVLLVLFQLQRQGLKKTKFPQGYFDLQKDLPPIDNESQIKDLMNCKNGNLRSNFCGYKKSLYLPFLRRDPSFVPLFMLKCDMNKSENEVSIYVMLYTVHSRDDRFNAIGFRFEGPHEGGEHNYWHAQIVTGIAERTTPISVVPAPLPTTIPCIPVKARGMDSLFLCMLWSFYGYQIFDEIRGLLDRHYMAQLDKRLDSLKGDIYHAS